MRNFEELIEAVDRGEEVTLVRDGVAIARVVPGRPTTADRLAEVIENHPLPPEAVDEWENAIKELRESQDDRERKWFDD
ncbi:type II toxin-antitoxin system Phd/YefM family antitoxin [Actinophytocola gossypii]|uniref:Type II toxin-antitoxin system prevent-host-death family antitoxin n=1 Tax=Actinophytocola gossypii TaxID=2812003 RepID=A0ABT2J7J9_9PSEU|nr:hypothetical protein [Actinophytocola gossypii]MCT2583594.1 hypothetical protein [Actinophytocola gossypii]